MLELHLHSICSCFYSGSAEQICFSQEYIKTLAHCNLEYLPSGCVSTLLGSCYQYQLKEVLPFSCVDTAGKWIGKIICVKNKPLLTRNRHVWWSRKELEVVGRSSSRCYCSQCPHVIIPQAQIPQRDQLLGCSLQLFVSVCCKSR